MDYQTVYDASVRVFQTEPAVVILLGPIFIFVCLYLGKLRRGHVPRSAKLYMWGAYLFYSVVAAGSYYQMWQDQSAAQDSANMTVVEGRLANAWVRRKEHSKSTDIYQHFTVRGIEFLQHNRQRNFLDFLIPRAKTPALPLIEGAQVRITYRGEGQDRTILKFEIAAADLAARNQ